MGLVSGIDGGRGVLKRNLARWVRPTQRNPDPVQDTKMNILLPCLRESGVFFYPISDRIQDWTKPRPKILQKSRLHKI